MSSFWLEVLLAFVCAGAAGLLTWFFSNAAGACAVGLTILLLFGVHHFRQLSRLLHWLEQPLGTPVPGGGGAWELVFAALHRRARKSAEKREHLGRALERFRHVIQALPDGVVILDAHHAIEWLNATAENHLGLSREHDTGFPISNLLREPAFVSYIEAAQYAEALILHPIRSPGRTLALQVVPYGDAQSLLLSRDISQLEKLETMRRDFVANVSHELKTPLTVVSGFIETLIDGVHELPEEETLNYLELAHEQALRMQRLILDLLMLSALETNSPPPNEERVPLDSLLAEVIDEAHALSRGQHEIELADTAGAVLLGSRSELRSAISNLLINAVRYTPEGGKIRVAWHQATNGGCTLSIADNGIGIDSQHLPRLTERFYRVDRGRSRESGGTGLGLAIVKHALTRHQAVLEIVSEPGLGSTFSARFPPQRVAH